MGRWSYSSRWTVEECKSISTKFLNEHHYFDGGIRWGGGGIAGCFRAGCCKENAGLGGEDVYLWNDMNYIGN